MQVDLGCSAVVRLTGHEEDYFLVLPALLGAELGEPLAATCCPILTGAGDICG